MKRLSLRPVMISALLLGLTWVSVAQGADPGGAVEKKSTDQWEQFPPVWEKALRTLGDDSLYLLTSPLRFDFESGLVTGGIVAGIVGLSFADRAIRHELAPHRHDAVRDAADGISYLGNGGVLFGLNARGGRRGRRDQGVQRQRQAPGCGARRHGGPAADSGVQRGLRILDRAVASGGLERSVHLKFGRDSFPSAHASQAFAVAAVISDRFDQPAGAIAYGLAGLVGLSRLVQDKHWASDVVGGAALGWAIGHFLSARHSAPHKYLDFFPFADPGSKTYGLVLRKEF